MQIINKKYEKKNLNWFNGGNGWYIFKIVIKLNIIKDGIKLDILKKFNKKKGRNNWNIWHRQKKV